MTISQRAFRLVATLLVAMCVAACNVTDPPRLENVDVVVGPAVHVSDTLVATAVAIIGPFEQWQHPSPVIWSVDDSTVVHLDTLAEPKIVVVRGVRVGKTLIHARIEDKEGIASVQVLP